jgi:pimeloyl-ACP methyl ester carboxylesterase
MKTSSRRIVRFVLLGFGALALLGVAAFLWWGLTPLGPSEVALSALESDSSVTVTKTGAGWVFAPASSDTTAGLVFYPGGHVDARSYAPYARDVASQGYLVVVPVMPLSLAVLSPNAASRAIERHPDIKSWALGGHSLGGVMAARYAGKNPDSAGGLVLLASYPAGGSDLSGTRLHVASLVGTQDTVVDKTAWEASRSQLPADAAIETLVGGNHAQFGDYGVQPGDTPEPKMSAAQQRAVAVAATVRVLRRR